MKPIPVKLVPLSEMSPIRERLLGSEALSPHMSYDGQYGGHAYESSPDDVSSDQSSQLGALAKGVASLPGEVASEVKVHLGGADGEAAIEIPLPGGGIAWIGIFQGPVDSELVVFFQSDPENVSTDVSRTINPTGLALGLDDIYSRLCAFVGSDSSSQATRKSFLADNTGKSKAAPAAPNKGSSGGRKRSSKSTPAKKKVRHTRSRGGNKRPKHRSQKRKNKKGKR